MLCHGCGNEIETGSKCPICADNAVRRKSREVERDAHTTTFCHGCGNTILGSVPCEICANAAPKPKAAETRTQLCPGCGNEVEDIHACPICQTGHGRRRALRSACNRILCLNCAIPMEDQDWDGVPVRICSGCQAAFFPPKALERIFDKLRDATEDLDWNEVVKELRDPRKASGLSKKDVRYRNCPDCDQPMSRVNYGNTSGIMLERCGKHGTWVEQHVFADVSDWISRGGDQLTHQARLRRDHNAPRFGR